MRVTRRTVLTAVVAACVLTVASGCSDSNLAPADSADTPAPATTATTATTASTAPAVTATAPAGADDLVSADGDVAGTGTVTSPAVSSSTVVDGSTFVADVQAFAQTLTQFGLTLQAAGEGPDALKQRVSLLRQQLDDMDAAARTMAGYRVGNAELERRRTGIVSSAGDVSLLARRLLDQAQKGDTKGLAATAYNYRAALRRLRDAATGA